MLGFLSNVAAPIAGIAGAATQLFGGRSQRVPQEYTDALAQQQALIAALDPRSAAFQSRVATETGSMDRDFMRAIEQIRVANQRQMARTRGRSGILSGERRDEALASALLRSRADAGGVARERVTNQLMQQLNAAGNMATSAQPLFDALSQQRQERASGISGILEGLQSLARPRIEDMGRSRSTGLTAPPPVVVSNPRR